MFVLQEEAEFRGRDLCAVAPKWAGGGSRPQGHTHLQTCVCDEDGGLVIDWEDGDGDGDRVTLTVHFRGIGHEDEAVCQGLTAIVHISDQLLLHLWATPDCRSDL